MNISDIINEFADSVTIADIVICLTGIMIFAGWLLKTSLGKNALADSKPRPNNMPFFLPLILWALWIALVGIGGVLTVYIAELKQLDQWQEELATYFLMGVFELILIFVILFVGWSYFNGRLKGFGLNVRTIGKDLGIAAVNFIAILPLVAALILLVAFLGQLIVGKDFEMQQNEGLVTIITNPQFSVRLTVFVFAALIVPVFEELLFRGLFQSMLRKRVNKTWPAIILTSVLFALLHPPTHWPALFVLSVCLGYSYEKSGSLFRPIFIHTIFNTASIITALNQ